MARATTKKPTSKPRLVKAKPKAPRPPKRTPDERKSKAIELCLHAIAGGWTMVRFCKWSKVSRSTMLRWMAEDTVQPRFMMAMQVKALALPDEAMELVKLLIAGGRFVMRQVDGAEPGKFANTWEPVDPKAIGVALRHYEFRMMREIKALYQPSRTVTTVTDTRTMPDDQLEEKIQELIRQAQSMPPAARH